MLIILVTLELKFQQPLLKSSVSHYASVIIWIFWFDPQEKCIIIIIIIIIIINV